MNYELRQFIKNLLIMIFYPMIQAFMIHPNGLFIKMTIYGLNLNGKE